MNYKNIILFTLLSLGFSSVSFAQQNPVMTHYTLNPYLYNPAQVGQDGFHKVNVHYRKQWVEMPDAPDTKILTFQTKLKNKFGLGVKVYMDKVHIVENIGARVSYAYYLNFKKNTNNHYLSFGVSAGFKNQRLRFDEANIDNAMDPSIFYNGASQSRFDADAGINYHFKGFNLGVAVANITPLAMNYSANDQEMNYKTIYHIYANAGYDIKLGANKEFMLKPSVLFRYVPNSIPFQFDANLLFDYKEIFWLGAGYRFEQEGVWGTAGARVHDMVAINYSFEVGLDGNVRNLGTTHEFSIELRLKNKKQKGLSEIEAKNKRLENKQLELSAENKLMKDSMQELKKSSDSLNVLVEERNQALKDFETKLENLQNSNASSETINNLIANSYESVGSVKFAKNAFSLSNDQLKVLKNIYAKMDSIDDENIVLIQLVGTASIEGSEEYNLILSNKRSESVRQYLMDSGISKDLITTTFKGNTEALLREKLRLNSFDESVNPDDRMVSIYILKK